MKKCTIEVKKFDDGLVRAQMIVNGNVARTAVAKCSPEDEFDFEIGAKLACDRLFEKKDKFVPYIKLVPEKSFENILVAGLLGLKSDVFAGSIPDEFARFGNIGEATKYKDENGVRLFVGDTVMVTSPNGRNCGESPIVSDKDDGAFVAGIASSCDSETGKIDKGWKIVKKRSYHDFSHGERIKDYKYILEEE